MNRAQLNDLPPALDVPTTATLFGMSRTAVYELIRTGQWPTPVFRLGKLIRIPTAPVLDLLQINAGHPLGVSDSTERGHRGVAPVALRRDA
jgi:predicted DNA-binding transcriptional regulator AlpA